MESFIIISYNLSWYLYFKKTIKVKKDNMQTDSIELGFLSIFALITFFIFLIIEKFSYKLSKGSFH